jgi:hypothetical protein
MPVNERRNRSLLKRLRVEPRRLVDQLLPGLPHVLPAEHGLDLVAVHYVADPDLDAAIPSAIFRMRPGRALLAELRRLGLIMLSRTRGQKPAQGGQESAASS